MKSGAENVMGESGWSRECRATREGREIRVPGNRTKKLRVSRSIVPTPRQH